MRSCKLIDSTQGNSYSNPFQKSINCKKTAIFSKGYLKTCFRVPRLTTLQPALKRWLTLVRRSKEMDKEQSIHATESCLHRSGFITPVEERRIVCIPSIDQRGYKKSTHQKREKYPLYLFSKNSRLHRIEHRISMEEIWIRNIQSTLKNEKRGRTNKRENNPLRIRIPLSLFLEYEPSAEKSSSYQREGAFQEENWHQSDNYEK